MTEEDLQDAEVEGEAGETKFTKADAARAVFGCLVLIVIAVLIFGWLRSCAGEISEGIPAGNAMRMAREALTASLVSPGSADWEETEIVATTQDGRSRAVFLVVDSQNKFGATLRTYAVLIMMWEEGDGSSVIDSRVFDHSPSAGEIRAFVKENAWLGDWVFSDGLK